MDQPEAVEGAMLDFNTRFPLVDEQIKMHVRYLLGLVWQVGYEDKGKELAERRWNTRGREYIIQQFNREGLLIGEYDTPQKAIRFGNICRTSLWKALNGRITIHGHTWKRKYIEK